MDMIKTNKIHLKILFDKKENKKMYSIMKMKTSINKQKKMEKQKPNG